MADRDPDSIYDFTLETLQGQPLPLKQFEGRPMVIVNTASKCGFTPQYKGLQKLWDAQKDKGLVVIGVPSNDFGGQEPGNAGEIEQFCEINFGVNFPLSAKAVVKGKDAHPLFKWLSAQGGFLSKPRWNFYKYLVGRDGRLSTWFASTTSPDAPKFQKAVERLVAKD